MPTQFVTKDSGKREDYDSGMRRDTEDNKTDFTYLMIDGVPYEDQPIHRVMQLYMRGAKKYGRHNWQKANSPEEFERFKRSLFRHWMQYLAGDRDEDHIAAVIWNAISIMYMEQKLELLEDPVEQRIEDLKACGLYSQETEELVRSTGSAYRLYTDE